MNIVHILQELGAYYASSRRVGHTTAVMRGASSAKPGAVLAVDQRHGENLRDMVDPANPVKIITLGELTGGGIRSAPRGALLLDNYTTMVLCEQAIDAITTATARAAELKRKLNEQSATIARLESNVTYLESQRAADLQHQIEHAAGNLPDGWQIRIDVENGSANVTVIQPDGTEECMSDGEADITEEFSYAGQYVFDGIRGDGETPEN